MITCFERIVDNNKTKALGGDWRSVYRVTMHRGYDLTVWHDDFDDIMRRIGADIDGDTIHINDDLYYVDCAHKVIRPIMVREVKEESYL